MPSGLILIDTNVIVAAVDIDHVHHVPSLELLNSHHSIVVAAHSYAEAHCTLTRRSVRAPFHWTPEEAWSGLESIAERTRLVGLSPAGSFAAVRDFAASGGIGARVYDYMIARAAQAAGAELLVTWNVGHLCGLIEGLEVRTPEEMAD